MSKVMTPYSNNGDIAQFVPVEENQLVDLDATYDELEGRKGSEMLNGLENYLDRGTLSRKNLEVVGISGCEAYEPMYSKLNAITGAESFLGSVAEGFKKFIKMIIEYINRGINWCVSRVRAMLGFEKTASRIKACEEQRSKVTEEISTALAKLGVNKSPEAFLSILDKAPKGSDKIEMLKFVKNKFDNEEQTVQRLERVIPLLEKLAEELRKSDSSILKEKMNTDKQIRACIQGVKRQTLTDMEVNSLTRSLADFASKALNLEPITKGMSKIITELTDIQFTNTEYMNDELLSIRKRIESQRAFVTAKVDNKMRDTFYASVSNLSKLIVSTPAKALDLSGVDPARLKNFIRLDDAEAIEEIAAMSGNRQLKLVYTRCAGSVRDYVNILELALKFFNETQLEIDNLCKWKYRCDAFLAVAVTNDIKLMNEHLEASRKEGHNWAPNGNWTPVVEELSLGSAPGVLLQMFMEMDVAGLKTRVNNFSRQVGLGVQVQ